MNTVKRGAGTSLRCLFGGLALAAALFLAPGEAQARDERETLVSGEAACPDDSSPYSVGIRYDAADSWVNGVTGGAQTTIASSTVIGWASGVAIQTAVRGSSDSMSRTIALRAGSGSNAAAAVRRHRRLRQHGRRPARQRHRFDDDAPRERRDGRNDHRTEELNV